MKQENRQQNNFENIDVNTIQYIIFKPFNEEYYSYSINSIENQHLIERIHVLDLMCILNKEHNKKVQYLIDRFFSFIYMVLKKELLELETSNDENEILNYIHNNFLEGYKSSIVKSEFNNNINTIYNKVLDKYNLLF